MYAYVIAFIFFLLNINYIKSIHKIWILSCIQALFLIMQSPILALLLIAISNVIYFFNMNYYFKFQNKPFDFIFKRLFVLFIIQSVLITLLTQISAQINYRTQINESIIILFIVLALFGLLLIKKKQHD